MATGKFLPRSVMQAWPMPSCGVRVSVSLSVYVSVTLVNSIKRRNMSSKIFSPSDSQAIVGFLYQTSWQYSDGNPPNGGVECRWGRHKSRFWAYIWLHTLRPVSQVVTLIPGSKRRSLLMAGGDDEMFMTKSLNVTPKTTEQYLIARSDKSVAYVTNNKRFCSTFCTIEANYWQTWSIARPLWDSRATCLYVVYS